MSRIALLIGAGLLSLTTSTAQMQPAKDLCPQLSWDHVPLYMHTRKATSYTGVEIK